MKFVSKNIVFQEIPNEISLSLEISNCPFRCEECHTPELQQDIGTELTTDVFVSFIEQNRLNNKMLISCVLFMGGDQHPELYELLDICKRYELKTALYTGAESIDSKLIKKLDYVKLGPFIKELGGLKSKTTNQILYRIEQNKLIKIGLK